MKHKVGKGRPTDNVYVDVCMFFNTIFNGDWSLKRLGTRPLNGFSPKRKGCCEPSASMVGTISHWRPTAMGNSLFFFCYFTPNRHPCLSVHVFSWADNMLQLVQFGEQKL